MKYRLGDICTITKGETGIMKAIPGAYTMVALGEANKTHNEFQFDTKAVIIPLVSSTGHGHASMKRVKYQEGKFALGSILCAVIPKDEKVILAKYLHIYLHWNKEELLVSQMRGMANVSLPMNKIADVIVIVPSIKKQQDIIDLEVQLVEKELSVEELLSDQLTQLENLNQAILQEAVQGKLVKQDPKDEPASELLKRIKAEKVKSGKKEKPLPPIKPEKVPFEIPESWAWCRLFDIISILGDGLHGTPNYDKSGQYYFINGNNLINGKIEMKDTTKRVSETEFLKHRKHLIHTTVFVSINGTLGNLAYYNGEKIILGKSACYFNLHQEILREYIGVFIKSSYFLKYAVEVASETTIKNVSLKSMRLLPIPLPPLSEQNRIVAKIEKQLVKTKQLKEHIIANQKATEQLLKALLHQAFEVEEMEEVNN